VTSSTAYSGKANLAVGATVGALFPPFLLICELPATKSARNARSIHDARPSPGREFYFCFLRTRPCPLPESYDWYPNSKEELKMDTQIGTQITRISIVSHQSRPPPPTFVDLHYPQSPNLFWKPLTIVVSFFSQTNMAGAQFEYDEKGTTFYYFLISFYGIVLVPVSYYVWKVTKLPGKLWKSSQLYAKQQWILVRIFNRTQLSYNKRTIHKYISYFWYDLWNNLISDDQKRAAKICRCPPCVEKRAILRKKEPKSKSIRYVR